MGGEGVSRLCTDDAEPPVSSGIGHVCSVVNRSRSAVSRKTDALQWGVPQPYEHPPWQWCGEGVGRSDTTAAPNSMGHCRAVFCCY